MAGADGFRVAKAFVEVSTEFNENDTLRAGRETGEAAGAAMGDATVRKSSERIRDSRGKFIPAGEAAGDEGGKAAGARLAGRMLSSIGEGLGKVGTKMIPDAFSSMPPQVAAPLTAAIVGAGLLAAPLLGAGIAGAVSGVALSGGIVGGVMMAAKDPRVQVAWSSMSERAGAVFSEAFGPFLAPVMATIERIGDRIETGWGESIRSIGQDSARMFEPLANGALSAIDDILPALSRLAANGQPIMETLGYAIEIIGSSTGEVLDMLSNTTGEQAHALRLLAEIFAGAILSAGAFLDTMARIYGWIVRTGVALGLLDQSNLALINSTNSAAGATATMGSALQMVSEDSDSLKKRQVVLNSSMEAGVKVAGSYAEMLDILNGAVISAEEAEDAFQAAVDEVTASVKANGKTLDSNTEKGRENRETLRNLAKAAQDRAAKTYEETAATKGSAAAQAAATKKYNEGREALIRAATQMGMSRREAEKYADKIMAIPKNWNTKVKADTSQAKNRIDEIIRIMRNIKSKTVTVTVIESILRQDDAKARQAREDGKASGGYVWGQGGDESDANLIPISNGEYVVRAKAARKLGPAFMNMINNADRLGPAAMHAEARAVPSSGGPTYITIPFIIGEDVIATQVIRIIDGRAETVSRIVSEGARSRSWTSARATVEGA